MLALQSVFIVTLICAIYSSNKAEAGTEIGRRAAIFIAPLLFCFNPFDIKKYRNNLFLLFSMTCTIVILYLFADAFFTLRHFKLPYSLLFSGYFANHNFSEPIDMHATFFSLQIAVADASGTIGRFAACVALVEPPLLIGRKTIFLICACRLGSGRIDIDELPIERRQRVVAANGLIDDGRCARALGRERRSLSPSGMRCGESQRRAKPHRNVAAAHCQAPHSCPG